MAVELISNKNDTYQGGFTRVYNSVDEARDQALHDLRQGAEPGPNRIEEDGNIVIDRAGLEKLARS
jgi:hypothetical protein